VYEVTVSLFSLRFNKRRHVGDIPLALQCNIVKLCVVVWRIIGHASRNAQLPWLFIGDFGTELQSTSPTAACQSQKFQAANISVRPTVANWIFRGFVAALLALGLSHSPVRRFGIHCQICCVIQPSSLAGFENGSLCRTLDVSPFHVIALYKSTFTYLLTYTANSLGKRMVRFPHLTQSFLVLNIPPTWRRVCMSMMSLHLMYT